MNLINFYRPLQDGWSVALPEKTFTSSPFQGTQGTSAIQELHRRDLFPQPRLTHSIVCWPWAWRCLATNYGGSYRHLK